MRPGELPDGAKLVDACPDTRFILDHCGNAASSASDLAAWKTDIAAVAARQNVVCKVSGIVASAKGHAWTARRPRPDHQPRARVFGPTAWCSAATGRSARWARRCASGSAPSARSSATGSEADQRKLFHDNAERVYRLK